MRKRKELWSWFLLTAMIAMSVLSGCGAGSSSKSASYMVETAAAAEEYPAAANGAYYSETTEAMAYDAADIAYEGGVLSGSTGLNGSSTAQPGTAQRKLIRNVNLNVETDDFDNLLKELQKQIGALSGYVEQSDISGNSITYDNQYSRRYASMTVRIPCDKLDQFIQIVETSGNVTYRSESTSDVTLQYADLESRKKSLTIEQERLWELLEKADSMDAIVTLEERLSEIRYELESMESQLRLYDNQVDYSTLYIYIDEVKIFTPTAPETVGERIQKGFSENLENLGTSLTNFFIWIIAASPIWVPLVLIVIIILLIAQKVSKRSKTPTKTPKEKKEPKDNQEAPKA